MTLYVMLLGADEFAAGTLCRTGTNEAAPNRRFVFYALHDVKYGLDFRRHAWETSDPPRHVWARWVTMPDPPELVERGYFRSFRARRLTLSDAFPVADLPPLTAADLRACPNALRYVACPTVEQCAEAVKAWGYSLRHVPAEAQTPDLCASAVAAHPLALKYVRAPTEAVCLLAVQGDGVAFRLVPPHLRTHRVLDAALRTENWAEAYPHLPPAMRTWGVWRWLILGVPMPPLKQNQSEAPLKQNQSEAPLEALLAHKAE